MDRIEAVNKANLKRLSETELRSIENSDNVSQHTKLLAFNELTSRNKTAVQIERLGNSFRKKKGKRV